MRPPKGSEPKFDPADIWRDDHPTRTATVVTDPHGIRHAMTPAGAVIVFDVHRLAVAQFAAMRRVRRPAICILLEDDRGVWAPDDIRIAIPPDAGAHLLHPLPSDPDWHRALVAIPVNRIWDLADVHLIATLVGARAGYVARYRVIEPRPLRANIDVPAAAAAELRDIAALTDVLGLPLLQAIGPPPAGDTLLLHLRDLPNTTAATLSPHGLTVRAGTIAQPVDPTDEHGLELRVRRLVLAEMGVLNTMAGNWVFTRDHSLRDPSTAAAIILGRPVNGWDEWQDRYHRPLRAILAGGGLMHE